MLHGVFRPIYNVAESVRLGRQDGALERLEIAGASGSAAHETDAFDGTSEHGLQIRRSGDGGILDIADEADRNEVTTDTLHTGGGTGDDRGLAAGSGGTLGLLLEDVDLAANEGRSRGGGDWSASHGQSHTQEDLSQAATKPLCTSSSDRNGGDGQITKLVRLRLQLGQRLGLDGTCDGELRGGFDASQNVGFDGGEVRSGDSSHGLVFL